MLEILWPTLLVAGVAVACLLIWATQPRLQRNQPLRVALIVAIVATVAFALIAAVEIFSRVLAFGLDEAF